MPRRVVVPAFDQPRQNPRWSTGRRALVSAILAVIAGDTLAIEGVASQNYFANSAATYQNFAATCPTATGQATTCGTNPGAPATWDALRTSGQTLFVWGAYTSRDAVGKNSTLLWRNTLTGGASGTETFAIKVTGVRLTASGAIGTALGGDPRLGQNKIGQPQGQGITGAWEALDVEAPQALIGDARVQIINHWTGPSGSRVLWYGNSPGTATGNTLIDKLPANIDTPPATTPWVNTQTHTTIATPIDKLFTNTLTAAQNTINPGQDIQIRFFDTDLQGPDGSVPDSVLSAMAVQVQYSRANLQGSLNFGGVRVGTTSVMAASIRNLTDATGGLSASMVVAGTASGPFAAVGGESQLIGTLNPSETYNTTALYSYTPTGLQGGNVAHSEESAPIDLTSPDALNTTFTASGDAVGPVFQLSGAGVSAPAGGGSITFDNVLVTDHGPQSASQTLTVTNAFLDPSNQYGDTLTGLTVLEALITGGAFSATLPAGVISDNNDTGNFNMTFRPTAATIGGQPYSASVKFRTDVNSSLGTENADGSGDYTYTLSGTAYQAAMQAAAVDFGFVRQGGAAKAKSVGVQNLTGGGFGLDNVTFGSVTGATEGATFAGVGNANIGTLASGGSGGRDYTLRVAETPGGPQTTPRALSGQVAVSSDQAPDVNPLLSGQAVSPVFNFSGADVNFTDHGACGGEVVCGTLDLGTLTPTSSPFALTIANLFGDLSGLLNEANLTLINVGFGGAYAQTWDDSTGTFSLSKDLSNTTLGPYGRIGSSAVTYLDFTSSSLGQAQGFSVSLRFLTDVDSLLGVAGTEFRFNVLANWAGASETPIPAPISLIGLGLAGLAGWRRPRG